MHADSITEKINIESIAVISTAHLPEHEANETRILNLVTTQKESILWRQEGFMVSTSFPIKEFPVMTYILGYMKAKRVNWVMFDRDAHIYSELPAYNW